jgi:hypothetical protein
MMFGANFAGRLRMGMEYGVAGWVVVDRKCFFFTQYLGEVRLWKYILQKQCKDQTGERQTFSFLESLADLLPIPLLDF